MALADRAVFEQGVRAFVSYIRAYGQHECSLICRIRDLDMAGLAEAFGLLKLPRMPELKELTTTTGTTTFVETDVDIAGIAYRDKAREKQRIANLSRPRKEKVGNRWIDGKSKQTVECLV